MNSIEEKALFDDYDYRISKDTIHYPLKYGKHYLYQVGRMHCNSHTVIPMHTQLNYIELTIASDGKAKVLTNGNAVDISAADIYISFPGDFHEIVIDEIFPLKYDYITIMTDDESLYAELSEIIKGRHDPTKRVIRDEHLRSLVARVISEINSPDRFTDTVIESLLYQIIISVIRNYKLCKEDTKLTNITDEKLLCLRIMNYIDNHIYTIKNLRELAAISNYSYNYMSNTFKRVTSDTLINYYQNKRFETAILLLKSGDYSVTQVAEMLNYSSVYSFSLAFKNRYGYPPSKLGI